MAEEQKKRAEQVVWDGETFDLLTEDDLLLAETRTIERKLKVNIDKLGEPGYGSSAMQALLWVSIKRRRPTIRFEDLDEVPLTAFRFLAPADPDVEGEAEGEAVDPSRPAGQDAATGAAPTTAG